MTALLKIEFIVPASRVDGVIQFLSPRVAHGWEETPVENGVRFRLYLEDHPFGMNLLREIGAAFPGCGVTHGEQENENWTLAWKDFFNPIACGEKFTIYPPWIDSSQDDGSMHIVIEPKMAFGTGHHATTALCLEAIGDLVTSGRIKPGQHFLDLGTGSGILGIGLAKMGLIGIGVDIDPLAVACAEENLRTNNVSGAMTLAAGGVDCLSPEARFDIVVANILSGPLIEMADAIISHVKAGGCLILSGILAELQADAVAQAYTRRGLAQPRIVVRGEWASLTWDSVGG